MKLLILPEPGKLALGVVAAMLLYFFNSFVKGVFAIYIVKQF